MYHHTISTECFCNLFCNKNRLNHYLWQLCWHSTRTIVWYFNCGGVVQKTPPLHKMSKCPISFCYQNSPFSKNTFLRSPWTKKKNNLNLVSLESLDSTLSNDIKLNFFDSKRPEKNKVDTFLIRREYHNTVVIQEEHITQFVLEGYNESHKVTSTTERKAENNARLPRSSMLCWPMREYLTLLEENSKSSTPCWGLT